MATKSSVYPNFYKGTLTRDFGNVPAGTDIGLFCPYDSEMNYYPTFIQGNGRFTQWNTGFNDTYRYMGYSSVNPFVNAKEVTVRYRPVIDSFPSTGQTFPSHIGTYDANNDIILYFKWSGSYGAKSLNVFLYVDDGTKTSGFATQIELYYSSSDDVNTAITKCNYLISNFKLYITETVSCSQNSLNMTTYDSSICYLIAIDGAYVWASGPNSDAVGTITWLTLSSTTEPYIPQPTPPSPQPSTDPYSPGGYSTSGGGNGSHDTSSDPIPIPGLPANIATGTGLFTAYNPDASQLAYFANKLWNRDPTTIDDWFRMLFGGDAFNAIIGLMMIPAQPTVGSNKNILLGNWDTGASAPVITSQYVDVNFGSLTLDEFWGNSIDYSPYTRVQLALPYIGIVEVDTDDVIGSVNTLTYHIDVFSGALCAMLHCVKGNLSSVIYQWSGSCGVTLPITGQNFNAVIGAVMGVGAAAIGSIAMASGPVGAAIGTAGSLAVGTGAVTGAAANMFGTMKGKVQKSGSFGASSGALGIMTPYFIITRPVQSIPSTQQATKGYPANISAHLGDLLGYTELEEVHLHNIPGTKDEVLEIESLLKKGVIF